ncbi:MAG: hypothetical protein JWL59_1588 [Chthoniobacteraceae bacterium]|nr:hypothetical protein [Chthoniobacteraceae bacterium]
MARVSAIIAHQSEVGVYIMQAPNRSNSQKHDMSWAMLLSFAAVIVGALCLLHYNVLYTEGEVMQGLFTLLVGLVAGFVLIGFHQRLMAAWCIILLGGSLLIWQAYQSRKWTIIHEDVVAIVQFAEETKAKSGQYPTNLDRYSFKNAAVRSHIYRIEPEEPDGFRLTYFMNDPGTSYWYSSRTGFGYYPD